MFSLFNDQDQKISASEADAELDKFKTVRASDGEKQVTVVRLSEDASKAYSMSGNSYPLK